MNAKKIMGAVLVALLAAALFVGAGAAATNTAFVYEKTGDSTLEGTWTSGNAVVTINAAGDVVSAVNFVPGTYKKGSTSLYIGYPTAAITGVEGTGVYAYSFIGGNLYQNADAVVITNTSAAEAQPVELYVTFPNGTKANMSTANLMQMLNQTDKALGTYSVQAVFDANDFVPGTLASLLVSDAVSFTVVEAGTATISAAATEILKSEPVILTITGQPGVIYNVTYDVDAFNVSNKQLYFGTVYNPSGKEGFQFTMPNTGKVEFAVTAYKADSEEKITLDWGSKSKSITINFKKGTLTAKTDAASYFIGDKVKVTGTTTAGDLAATYNLTGTNVKLIGESVGTVKYGNDVVKTFEFEINTADLEKADGKKLDVGTYTVTISAGDAKATVSVVLKQPFVSIIEAPEVIVQGKDAKFLINAEATEEIAYYVFGTNYFNNATTSNNVKNDEGEPIENQFEFTLDGDDVTDDMDAGQYFMVVQHPMYDKKFNIRSVGQSFYLNTTPTGISAVVSENSFLFNVSDRQTANAAQALCDALDTQNIDDMYVKYSFFVVGEDQSFTISDIPTEVVKGDKIVISGVSTVNADAYVTAEMISTAFAAVPKETVGSAAFIAVTTQIAEDGTWEVTFDTSDLNVDEYSLKVACGEETWKTVTVNVVEGAETPDTPDTPDVPDTPDTPDTPTEPETPGFGALAALAGLGAVAVLLLRRE